MASQVQVGGVAVSTEAANPLGNVVAGINTGADWAARSYELQNKRQALEQNAQKMAHDSMKAKYDIGQAIKTRMDRIASLPKGVTKNSEIDMIGVDMEALGMKLHPSAAAMMKDDSMSAALKSVLESIEDPSDPAKTVASVSAMPLILSRPEAIDIVQKAAADKAAKERAIITAAGVSGALDKKLSAEAAAQTARFGQESKKQETEFEFKARQAEEQKAFDAAKQRTDLSATATQKGLDRGSEQAIANKRITAETRKDLRSDAQDLDKEFSPMVQTLDIFASLTGKKGSYVDKVLTGRFQTLREGVQSVLREGELKQIQGAGGLGTRFENWIGGLVTGQELTAPQKKEMRALAVDMRRVTTETMKLRYASSWELHKGMGLKPSEIFGPAVIKLMRQQDAANSKTKAPTVPVSATAPAPANVQAPTVPIRALQNDQIKVIRGAIAASRADPAKLKAVVDSVNRRLQAVRGSGLTPAEMQSLGVQ